MLILKDIILFEANVIAPSILTVDSPKVMSTEFAETFLVQRSTACIRTSPEQLKELLMAIVLGRSTLIISPV